MTPLQLVAPMLLCAGICAAQSNFSVSDGSAKYTAKITVEKCEGGACGGKGTVQLLSRQNGRLLQTFTSDDLYFFLDSSRQPTVNTVELYGEQSPLIFDDFNFDGTEDLAIRNGNNSGYGGPSYDVYVYNITRKQFVPSSDLTALASENLGMFEVDKANRQLVVRQKSGCCWHATTSYKIVPGKGLLKVKEVTEDAQGGENVTVTTSRLVNGKMVKNVKRYKIKDYYKD